MKQQRAKKNNYKGFISAICVFLVAIVFHNNISKNIRLIELKKNEVNNTENYLKIQDFAYHIIVVKHFWLKKFGNIYEYEFQKHALSDYIGAKVNFLMPIATTPIALIVWFPFACLAHFDLSLSYTFWMTFSFSIFFRGIFLIWEYFKKKDNFPVLATTLILLTIFSMITFRTIILGQTSLIATGAIIWLIALTISGKEREKQIKNIFLLLIILGLKPPYLVIGIGFLLIYCKYSEGIIAITLVFVTIIALTPFLGIEWMKSYLNVIKIYSQGNFPTVYSWSIAYDTMNIFRSAYGEIIGRKHVVVISYILSMISYFVVSAFILMKYFQKKTLNNKKNILNLELNKERIFIVLTSSYLLFAPYAGAYEDLLLIPIFVISGLFCNYQKVWNIYNVGQCIFLITILSNPYLPKEKPLWLFWIMKFIIILIIFMRSKEANKLTRFRS